MAGDQERILPAQKGVDDVRGRYYTDDPLADFARWDAEQARWLERRPVCDECGEHVQHDRYYMFDGKLICPECLEENHMHYVDE